MSLLMDKSRILLSTLIDWGKRFSASIENMSSSELLFIGDRSHTVSDEGLCTFLQYCTIYAQHELMNLGIRFLSEASKREFPAEGCFISIGVG